MMVAAIDGLIENGVLPAHADDPSPGFDIDAMINVLPYVLRDAMARQIDRLDPDARALLEAASLVGGDVTATAVAPIAGTDASCRACPGIAGAARLHPPARPTAA